MRHFKFRGWHVWHPEAKGEMCVSSFGGHYISFGGGVYNGATTPNITLMQYIGLDDKNGIEIYEGDIVLTDEAGWKGKVVYERDRFMVVDNKGGFSSACNWEEFEVIGNIYQTPELLDG
jgi:uncharacterized phage protein (TIGR01671 family)